MRRVCKISKQEKIWYIAHSQGTLLIFANQEAGDAETRERLHGIIALAPILSLKNVKGRDAKSTLGWGEDFSKKIK